MTDRKDLVGRYACRLCRHDQWEHDRIVGCPHCPCVATPGEAGARTDRELDFAILPASECLPGYSPLRVDPEPERPSEADWDELYAAELDYRFLKGLASNGLTAKDDQPTPAKIREARSRVLHARGVVVRESRS